MSWIGLLDPKSGRFATHPEATRLPRGALILEANLSERAHDRVLLHVAFGGRALSIMQDDDSLEMTLGSDRVRLSLKPGLSRECLRMSYAWDLARNWAGFSVEYPGDPIASFAEAPLLASVHSAGLLASIRNAQAQVSDDVISLALSNRVEPVGPSPFLARGTPIATPDGDRPVETLRCGDEVVTDGGTITRVLHNLHRTVPAMGRTAPIRLRAPYFELAHDIMVAADQRVVLRGSEVEYTFGLEAVLVPAGNLVNGFAAQKIRTGPLITYHHLLLPRHENLICAGTPMESVHLARLRRHPTALGRSMLHSVDSALLPEHAAPRYPVLGPFDAHALMAQRAA